MTLDLAFAFGNLQNIEQPSLSLEDLSLESQIGLLEAFKSWKDCEKGAIRGKGFANASNRNASRNPSIFTSAEAKAAKIFDSLELSYEHELRIQLKDAKNRSHLYKLDFFFPESRIDVEISPDFHWTYRLVAIREVLKERLLKRAGIRVYHVRAHTKKLNGRVSCVPDIKELRKLAKIIKEAETKPNCLKYWFK